jgi:hypothetical protein
MKSVILALALAALTFSVADARGHHHYGNQGGHYVGGHGSSHRGGHYMNARTHNHYSHHRH